jgi:hypothetical protein
MAATAVKTVTAAANPSIRKASSIVPNLTTNTASVATFCRLPNGVWSCEL